MANVYIDNKKIIPAPFYAISHDINRSGGGEIISCVYSVNLTGSLIANKGSPNSTGGFGADIDEAIFSSEDRFASLLQKQKALRSVCLTEADANNAKSVIIRHVDDTTGLETDNRIEFNYFVSNIEFEPSTTTDISNYTISFFANDIKYNGQSINPAPTGFRDYNLKSANDNFSVEWANDYDNTVTVTRTVNAQSAKHYTGDVAGDVTAASGFAYAKEWVKSKFPNDIRSGPSSALGSIPVYSLPNGYIYVNSQVSEQFDKLEGSYGITVRWLYAPDTNNSTYCSDDYSVNKSEISASSKRSYKISGTIKGYQTATRSVTAANAAKNYFDTLTNATFKNRINAAFGVSTNDLKGPTVNNYTYSPFAGTVNYDLEFYELTTDLPSCFVDVEISMTENKDERVIAEIPIPGRSAGPIIQDIKTKQAVKRTINATFTVSTGIVDFTYLTGLKASGMDYIDDVSGIPSGTENTNFWKTGFSHSLDLKQGKYNISVAYVEDN